MVYHRCLFCNEESIKKVIMLTRKKSAAAMSSSQVRRCNAESADINKEKKSKLQQKDEIEPTRRSSRGKRNVPVDMPSPPIQRSRKRKPETADPNNNKKLKTFKEDQKEHVKKYCWMCHKLAEGQTCTCKRVYHKECLEKNSKVFENNECPECQLKSVNGTELTRPFIGGLKIYLESATKWITEKHKNTMLSWSQNCDVVPSIDIETLLKKVQNNSFKTTAEFYADVKWFYHNCCIQYGEHSKQSKDMKKIIKEFREELFDMEACPECYYHLYIDKSDDLDDEDSEKVDNSVNDKFFVRLCNPPHDIVWAKVAGYSHYPAKCLKIINGRARVRFFGKHEKSDIPINTIFHISRSHPMYEYRNITDTESRTSLEYTYAKRELLKYIAVYEKNIGDFQFFGFRAFYEPDSISSKTGKETCEPGVLTLTTSSSPVPTPTGFNPHETTIPSANNEVSVDMTFCVEASTPDNSITASVPASHFQGMENTSVENTLSENPVIPFADSTASSACMSPVSSTESFSTTSTCRTADSHSFQIKQECEPTNQISSFAESSSNETSNNLMQIFGNALLRNSTPSETGGNTSATESCLASILQNCYSHNNNSERAIASPISVPDLPIIKQENYDCQPSTSQIHQPEKQINSNSTENASTVRDQQSPEPEVGSTSSNSSTPVIDLTEDDDNGSTPTTRLSNLLVENPQLQNLYECTHKVVGTFMTRLCEEVFKKQTPEPDQMCKTLTKKLNETEKKFQEETEKLRDEIKRLQKSLATEK